MRRIDNSCVIVLSTACELSSTQLSCILLSLLSLPFLVPAQVDFIAVQIDEHHARWPVRRRSVVEVASVRKSERRGRFGV